MSTLLFESLLMGVYAQMRLARILPQTDIVFELNKILEVHAHILLKLTEEHVVYNKDLKELWSKSQRIVKQIENLKTKEKSEKRTRKS